MKLFGIQFGKNNDFDQMEIRFHKQANHFGEHGRLNATHVKQGLVEFDVRFVIVGVTTPPKMDKNLFLRIWEEARAQGYTPHYLAAYGTDNEIASPTKEAVEPATAPEPTFYGGSRASCG